MHFFSLLALPLLSLTLANPLPNAESAELALRDAANSLSARTFFEHDWRCNNDWAKTDCKKKGGEWACDKSCVCIQKPVECGTYCPLRSLKKTACELKWGYDFNDDNCSCDKSKPTCDDADKKKSTCSRDQGWWNQDKCQCEGAKCSDCDGKSKDCGSKGGKWDEPNCKCNMPPTCPDADNKKSTCARDQGWWNQDKCQCEGAKCSDCDGQSKDCGSKGGKWDESNCKCNMPEPSKPEEEKKCGSWWSIWLCKLKGKYCDSGCNCY